MTLDEAIDHYKDEQLIEWLKELRQLRAEKAWSPYPRRRARDLNCPGCGGIVAKEGFCHSCRHGANDPEDDKWLRPFRDPRKETDV